MSVKPFHETSSGDVFLLGIAVGCCGCFVGTVFFTGCPCPKKKRWMGNNTKWMLHVIQKPYVTRYKITVISCLFCVCNYFAKKTCLGRSTTHPWFFSRSPCLWAEYEDSSRSRKLGFFMFGLSNGMELQTKNLSNPMLMFSKSGFATTKKSKIPCIIRLDMHELFNPGCLFQAQLQISTQKRQLSNWANEWARKSIENHDILPPWSYLSIFICPMYFHATSFKRPLPHEYPITWPWKQLLPQESIRLVGRSLQYLNTLVGGPWKKCRINVWHWLFSRLSDGYIWVAQYVSFPPGHWVRVVQEAPCYWEKNSVWKPCN